jgi:hypothetical protein
MDDRARSATAEVAGLLGSGIFVGLGRDGGISGNRRQPMNPRSPQQTVMTKTQTYYAYSLLWWAANEALAAGLASERGGGFHFLSSIVLRAFSFEAFINTTAETLVANFEEFERRRTPDKIAEVFRLLNVTFPGGMKLRPLQTLTEVFHFRNAMAHGRTETIKPKPSTIAVTEKMEKQLERRLSASWEPFIRDSKFAERAKEDIELKWTPDMGPSVKV